MALVEIDRSRVLAFQACPRSRWLAYHAHQKGLQRKAKGLPLVFGGAFHEGAEELLRGDIETACYRAMKFLRDSFLSRGVGMDGEEANDATVQYSAQEQMALVEALIRSWGLHQMPTFLDAFELIEVEQEGRANLTEDLVLMFRPDAIVREKLSGDQYVISWKTASAYGKRNMAQAKTDFQSISEVFGVIENGKGPIEGVLYLWIVKGKRMLDDWDNQWKQSSHLIYGWKKLKPTDEFDTDWSWSYKWPKEDGSGNSTLGKGWKKLSVWDNYPGGVKQWITDLHERKVFPRHLDPFESVFPQSLPVERRADEVEHWRNQVVAQELKIVDSLAYKQKMDDIGGISDYQDWLNYLDEHFPQYTHSCHAYSGCAFLDICFNGVPAETGDLYQIRQSNHPEKEGDEE